MDLLELKRDLPSVEDGRWVDKKEVPGLRDIRVKVRGQSAKIVRELFAHKERGASESERIGSRLTKEGLARITREVVSEATLIDIEGLTIGGEVVDVSRVRNLILDPSFEPLVDLIAAASMRVENTRVADLEKIKGNS